MTRASDAVPDPVPSSARSEPPTGFRLPDETRVGRVRLQVGDLERSLAWYRTVLGLRELEPEGDAVDVEARDPDARRAWLGPDGGPVLVELFERPGARSVARRPRLGLFHFALLVPDRAALGRFVTHVAAAGEPIGSADHAVSEALYLHDPDGLGVEVYADRPRAEWRRRGDELLMTTEPLDLRGLAASAGPERWDGMPAGTTMGHVHLHVGDLAEAERFYHGTLGLDKTVWSYPGALFLSAGGYHHHLGVNSWAAGAPPATDEDARLLEWELIVPTAADRRGVLARLGSAPGAHGLARDPWGTAVRVRDAGRD
jgi:catechol 2,3-dioxygenase